MKYFNTKTILLALLCVGIMACKNSTNETDQGTVKDKTAEIQEGATLIDDPENEGEKMLLGSVRYIDFKNDSLFPWMSENYKSYTPDATISLALKEPLEGISIKAFMGTWCEDSQREVPHFYKILNTAGVLHDRIKMVAMSHDKDTPKDYEKDLNIAYVPTFIFYKKGKEIGRFVEYAQGVSLEDDILTIIKGESYTPAYTE
ncbi:MAG: thiol-disulfide isomerase/thioredoxin [Saprospiraceae bacterium]|jgi:thiol-disulfide isomerase/thioredoxin